MNQPHRRPAWGAREACGVELSKGPADFPTDARHRTRAERAARCYGRARPRVLSAAPGHAGHARCSGRAPPNVRRSGRRVVRWPVGGDARRRRRPRGRHRPADAGGPRAHHAWQWPGSDRAASRVHSTARRGSRHHDARGARTPGTRPAPGARRTRRGDTAGRPLLSGPELRGPTTVPCECRGRRDQPAGRLTSPSPLRAASGGASAASPPTARPAACPPRGGA